MPKAGDRARRERRRAEARLSTSYGWPTRRRTRVVDAIAFVLTILAAGGILALVAGWHL